MDNFSFLVFDSGFGGLCVFSALEKAFSNCRFYYACDRQNLPFGSKSESELKEIAFFNTLKFNAASYDGVIFACNTLSCVAAEGLEEKSGVPVFGVFPKSDLKGKTLLLCTEATAKSKLVKSLDNNYLVYPAPSLAKDVEDNIANLSSCDLSYLPRGDFDNVVLGCTHYIFLKSRLASIYENATFYDGTEGLFCALTARFPTLIFQKNEKTRKNRVLRDHFLGAEKDENYSVFCKYFSN